MTAARVAALLGIALESPTGFWLRAPAEKRFPESELGKRSSTHRQQEIP